MKRRIAMITGFVVLFASAHLAWAAKLALPEEYPIVKIDIQTRQGQTDPELLAAIDQAIFTGVRAEPNAFIRRNMEIVLRSFLSRPLIPGTSFQIYSGTAGVILPLDPGPLPFTGSANLHQITIPGVLAVLPLTLRWVVMHEVVGHYSQYLRIYELYEFSKNRPGSYGALMNMPNFVHDFYKVTHPTTALMELQFYRAVPRQKMIAELKSSALADRPKQHFIDFINLLYDRAADPIEYIKFKARLEAGSVNGVNGTTISDEDFDLFFKEIKSRGFNLEKIKPASCRRILSK